MFIGKYNISLLITYLGVAASIAGINFAIGGNIKYSYVCLIAAGACDLFDGMFARMCKRGMEEKLFGVEADTLADMVNFVALPIAIFFSQGFTKWYHVIIYTLFALAAITRLGFFNMGAKKTEGPVKYYQGLPVTYVALILPIVWVLTVHMFLYPAIHIITILLITALFVLNIKIAKPKGLAYLFFAVLAIA
ncbi:MAG: CDP-alcohol phosphatidyltransferase family protein, partial [Clostridiales bacterium]|nr:CDP-alcohol phosphatidyltransferase family protein [Clostridiales bacterium]